MNPYSERPCPVLFKLEIRAQKINESMNQKEVAEQATFKKRRFLLLGLLIVWLVLGLPASVFIAAGLCHQWRPQETVPYYRRTARQRDYRCLSSIIGLIIYPLVVLFAFFAVALALIHQMIPRRPSEERESKKSLKQIHDAGQVMRSELVTRQASQTNLILTDSLTH